MKLKSRFFIKLAAIFCAVAPFAWAEAQVSFSVTDLGTLGGTTSTANSVAAQGTNAAGMIVGSSTTADNAEHAFVYASGQMFDLNTLCDLSTTDFRVLTVARAINDSCVIIGEGITKNGNKHAFMLTPLAVAGGQWSYACCQWVWIQQGGGWWWEESCGCYKWHGPPGDHPRCPPEPPPCWWYPLPCPPPCHRPSPTPTPPTTQTPTPPTRRTPPPNETPTPPRQTPPPTYSGSPVGVLPSPTPTLPPAVRKQTPSRRHGRGTPTPNVQTGKPLLNKPRTGPGTQENAAAPTNERNKAATRTRQGKKKSSPRPTPE